MKCIKCDDGKAPIALVEPSFIEGIAHVLAFGAKKYDEHNWRLGMKWSRMYSAAMRHLMAFWQGEDIDEETNLSHLYHAACCLMFLAWYWETGSGEDDRWREES